MTIPARLDPMYTHPYVAEAARSTRTEAEARVQRFLGMHTYQIICEPKRGEFYTPETEWPTSTSGVAIFDHLKQFDDAAYVICRHAGGADDVSEFFAKKWMRELIRDGFDPREDMLPRFVGRYLTDDEVDQFYKDARP